MAHCYLHRFCSGNTQFCGRTHIAPYNNTGQIPALLMAALIKAVCDGPLGAVRLLDRPS